MYKVSSNTLFTGKQIIYLPSCQSTNQFAADLLSEKKVAEGAVVITDHQMAGRGQRGNTWESEAGANLTFSLILRPGFLAVHHQFYLTMVASLAMYELLSSYGLTELKIKWPNDLYCGQGKISGILIENTVGKGKLLTHSIVGIGINVNQIRFQNSRAVSIAGVTHKSHSLPELLDQLLPLIEKHYLRLKQGDYERLRRPYIENLYWLKEQHTFKSNQLFDGVIMGIDDIGRLEVENKGTKNYYDTKQITFVK